MSGRVVSRAASLGLACLMFGAPAVRAGPTAGWPDDPKYPAQQELAHMGIPEAWERATGRGVVLALMGTDGVDYLHEDLASKLLPGRDGRFEDDDHPEATGSHDTAMAGVAAAATNNGKGIAGAAPHAMIMPIRTRDDHEDTRWAVDNGADVLFFEYGQLARVPDVLGFTGDQDVGALDAELQKSIEYAWNKGAVLLGGAGNWTTPFCSPPAYYRHVLCVGAIEHPGDYTWGYAPDVKADYSNFGFGVDVFASGDAIAPYYNLTWSPDIHDGYGGFAGTSVAVAYAAGIAALLLEAGASNEEVVRLMKCTAMDMGPEGPDLVYGHGFVNAARAVAAIGSGLDCPEPPRTVVDLLD